MRVVGGVIVVPIGLRAILRTIRFVTSKWARTLSVALRAPVPHVAGPFQSAPLRGNARFDIVAAQGDRYFCAVDANGQTKHLVTVERQHEPAYRELGVWLQAEGHG